MTLLPVFRHAQGPVSYNCGERFFPLCVLYRLFEHALDHCRSGVIDDYVVSRRRGKKQVGDAFKTYLRIEADRFAQLKAIEHRHVDVGNNKERIDLWFLEKRNSGSGVAEKVNLVWQIHVGEYFDEEMQIIVVIINQYNGSLFIHRPVYCKYMSNSGAERVRAI